MSSIWEAGGGGFIAGFGVWWESLGSCRIGHRRMGCNLQFWALPSMLFPFFGDLGGSFSLIYLSHPLSALFLQHFTSHTYCIPSHTLSPPHPLSRSLPFLTDPLRVSKLPLPLSFPISPSSPSLSSLPSFSVVSYPPPEPYHPHMIHSAVA